MFPRKTIYQFGKSLPHGVVFVAATRLTRAIYGVLRGVGASLASIAIIGLFFTYGPIVKEELIYKFNKKEVVVRGFGDLIKEAQSQSSQRVKEETSQLDINSYFSVYVPKIKARSDIVANVDAANEKEYLQALKDGVAHAAGTNFPGQGKVIFLFAHSTDSPINIARYNAVFYLLRKLEKGDRITVYFLDKKFEYRVIAKTVAEANDTSWMQERGYGELLVLQTCDPPGTTWKRLLVVAKPI